MKTIGEILKLAADFLQRHGVERAKREAEELVADVLACKRIDLFLRFETVLTDEQLERCRSVLKQRARRVPLAYISGMVSFAGIELQITPDVLIPRPETEALVEMIAKRAPQGHLLDLCCGSGAIGLALKARFPALQVTLADLSPAALAVARKNACRLGLEVQCIESDLLHSVSGRCDLIVCNPPYVAEGEYDGLSPEVKQEPKCALVAGPSGYEHYLRLVPQLEHVVAREVWFEIGTGMGERLKKVFDEAGWHCTILHDFAGHQRYLSLHR